MKPNDTTVKYILFQLLAGWSRVSAEVENQCSDECSALGVSDLEWRQAEMKSRMRGTAPPDPQKRPPRQKGYHRGGTPGRTWKWGEKVGYFQYHLRVRQKRGRPQHCEECGTTDPGARYEWANLTGKFEDPNDYIRLCCPCHRRRDFGKLTLADIETIRNDYASGYSQRYLAKRHSVSSSLVSRIVRGESPRRTS